MVLLRSLPFKTRSWRYRVAVLFAVSLLIFSVRPAQALDPAQPISELRHAKWSIADGAPANILAIAQTSDGFIWLGTATGLYRFDGITFELIQPVDRDPARSLQVTALLAARNGDLWVGYDYGGFAVYRNGKLHSVKDGTPRGAAQLFAEGSDGAIWAMTPGATAKRLRYFKDGRSHWLILETAAPQQSPHDILTEPSGRIIVSLYHTVLRIDPRTNTYSKLSAQAGQQSALARDSDGNAWILDNDSLRRLDGSGHKIIVPDSRGSVAGRKMLLDRDGSFWITASDKGLIRVPASVLRRSTQANIPEESVEVFSGILGPIASSIFEDREGNVWVGSAGGLDRLSAVVVHLDVTAPPLMTGFVRDPASKTLSVGTVGGLYRIYGASPQPKHAFSVDGITSIICGDERGRVLMSTTSGLYVVGMDGKVDRTIFQPKSKSVAPACAPIGNGDWVIGARDIYVLRGGKVSPASGPITGGAHPMMIRSLGPGDLIFYRALDGLRRFRGGQLSTLWQGRDIPVGFIKTVTAIPGGLLIGGEHGIARYDGRRFQTIDDSRHPFLVNVGGILPRSDGSTWIITAQGIAKISTADLEAAFDDPTRKLPAFIFGRDLGLQARSDAYNMSDVAEDASGRVWFATNRGLAWVDPNRLDRNLVAPPVAVRSLLADDRPVMLGGSSPVLPAGTLRIAIDFTALSFTDPAANKFRYRLTGFDKGWVDTGVRRQADYANLLPGHYRFQVIASNGDGVWNKDGASIEFSIAPHFYQTWWFAAVVALVISLLLVALVRWRTRSIASEVRARVEARVEERERIARELHDTLLQGLQGLMMRFQAVAEVIPVASRARAMIEKTLERGDDIIVQSRERVRDLRASTPGELEKHIAALGFEDVEVRVTGNQRLICGPVIDELVAIVSEALSNAQRHARARIVIVEIHHSRRALEVTVRDDGDGIDHAILANGGRGGHFGLQGMRERAETLGATFKIESSREMGTVVRVRVPTRIAYRSLSWWPWQRGAKGDL